MHDLIIGRRLVPRKRLSGRRSATVSQPRKKKCTKGIQLGSLHGVDWLKDPYDTPVRRALLKFTSQDKRGIIQPRLRLLLCFTRTTPRYAICFHAVLASAGSGQSCAADLSPLRTTASFSHPHESCP